MFLWGTLLVYLAHTTSQIKATLVWLKITLVLGRRFSGPKKKTRESPGKKTRKKTKYL